jgi:hypothetical protein
MTTTDIGEAILNGAGIDKPVPGIAFITNNPDAASIVEDCPHAAKDAPMCRQVKVELLDLQTASVNRARGLVVPDPDAGQQLALFQRLFLLALQGHVGAVEPLVTAVDMYGTKVAAPAASMIAQLELGRQECLGKTCGPDRAGDVQTVRLLFAEQFRLVKAVDGFFTVPRDGMNQGRATESLSLSADGPTGQTLAAEMNALGYQTKSTPIVEALRTLAGDATREAPKRLPTLPVRSTRYNGGYLIDLANDAGEYVHVTADGWEILPPSDDLPVFRVSATSLPRPERGGTMDGFREHLSFRPDDTNWKLIRPWMATALMSDIERPFLYLSGESGAGKTARGVSILGLIDPVMPTDDGTEALDGAPPEDEKDLVARYAARYTITSDNLTKITQETSDRLCRVVTGYKFSTRKLYTDGEMIERSFMRTGVLTGIDIPLGLAGDGLNRVVHVALEDLASRREKSEVVAERAANAGLWLGALLDDMSRVMREANAVELPRFERFAVQAKAALIFGEDYYQARVDRLDEDHANRGQGDELMIQVACTIRDKTANMLPGQPRTIEMTSGELLKALGYDPDGGITTPKWMPRNATSFGAQLRKNADSLRALGVTFANGQRTAARRPLSFTFDESLVRVELPAPKAYATAAGGF